MVMSPLMPEKQSKYNVFMAVLLTFPFMLLDVHARLKNALRSMIGTHWGIETT
jgi:hypothetical protein